MQYFLKKFDLINPSTLSPANPTPRHRSRSTGFFPHSKRPKQRNLESFGVGRSVHDRHWKQSTQQKSLEMTNTKHLGIEVANKQIISVPVHIQHWTWMWIKANLDFVAQQPWCHHSQFQIQFAWIHRTRSLYSYQMLGLLCVWISESYLQPYISMVSTCFDDLSRTSIHLTTAGPKYFQHSTLAVGCGVLPRSPLWSLVVIQVAVSTAIKRYLWGWNLKLLLLWWLLLLLLLLLLWWLFFFLLAAMAIAVVLFFWWCGYCCSSHDPQKRRLMPQKPQGL